MAQYKLNYVTIAALTFLGMYAMKLQSLQQQNSQPTKPRFVAGAVGQTNRAGSVFLSVEGPSAFEKLVETCF